MGERRSFSRTPRKALSREARQQLISDMLDEEFGTSTVEVTEIGEPARAAPAPVARDTLADSFDALDALDAQPLALEDELRSPERDETEHDTQDHQPELQDEDDAAFDALLAEFEASDDHDDDDLDETVALTPPYELEASEALALGESYRAPSEPAQQAAPVSEPEPEPELPPARSDAEKARQERLRAAYQASAPALHIEPADRWNALDVMPVDVEHLEQNLVITASRNEPAHGAFDVLRTRLVQTLLEHNWKRVAVTSPTRNCGKTFTSVNLAISLSRYEATRTILMDFDMRNPSVAGVIGDTQPGKMGDFLRGTISAEELLVRFDQNTLNIGAGLAIGTNNVIEPYASELAHEPSTRASLDRMMEEMSPDIVLFDMPPALAFDDVIAFRQHFDGVLMVVGGGETSPEEVREVMRRMGEETPLLGVVLNQAEGEDGSDYSYGY
ncbi:CpsD/CapB family tyrosine-protein kinase [Lentibacter algarum]|uniref:CpsD/CapB family tyrosine-protein kinase n=1 Tax=Lentibacter algarum TaxID=576131 RepID=UPI00235261A0|nr:CpsD/CapB family tyrosine-protein kinase [Lentibacter algarum]MCO4829213.1 CpsD/CapB family tyrosine-protein kinase [Lentibacter algarum]